MVEIELRSLLVDSVMGGMAAVTLYLTVVSGYLVVAYVVGKDLARFQVIYINSLFTFFGAFFVAGTYRFFHGAYNISLEIDGANLTWLARSAYAICIAEILGIAGALKFMFDIRSTG